MKNAKTILFGILMMTVTLSALVAPAAAEKYVHSNGILMTTYPQHIVVFWGRPGEYSENLALFIRPPWYFVEEFTGFDSIKVTMTLRSDCYQCKVFGPNPPELLGAGSNNRLVVTWSSYQLYEEDNGALIEYPITFVISPNTSRGYYELELRATAEANGLTFLGWTHIPVSVVG
jgi:hypothetical protein